MFSNRVHCMYYTCKEGLIFCRRLAGHASSKCVVYLCYQVNKIQLVGVKVFLSPVLKPYLVKPKIPMCIKELLHHGISMLHWTHKLVKVFQRVRQIAFFN